MCCCDIHTQKITRYSTATQHGCEQCSIAAAACAERVAESTPNNTATPFAAPLQPTPAALYACIDHDHCSAVCCGLALKAIQLPTSGTAPKACNPAHLLFVFNFAYVSDRTSLFLMWLVCCPMVAPAACAAAAAAGASSPPSLGRFLLPVLLPMVNTVLLHTLGQIRLVPCCCLILLLLMCDEQMRLKVISTQL